MKRLLGVAAALLLCLMMLAACRSHQIECTVKNRTGAPIELLEVDYPSASFGLDSLANGADYSYKFQVRGSGQLTAAYTVTATHAPVKITGPEVEENQQGTLEIVLMPDGKAEFYPALSEPR